jgi:hypothetical protein
LRDRELILVRQSAQVVQAKGLSEVSVFFQKGDQIGDLLGVGGGGGELVSELDKSASILALSSA